MEQLAAGHEVAGVMLRCGFLLTLVAGAWQDMRNRKIKISLIAMSGTGGAVLRVLYIVLDTAVTYQGGGRLQLFGLAMGRLMDTVLAMAVGGGLLLLSRMTKEAVGKAMDGSSWYRVFIWGQ